MTEIVVPALSLVVLVGVSGSGKSTFAARNFGPYETVSSDHCRALVSDDDSDQSASGDAFDLLEFIAGKRLAAGRFTVVDATNLIRRDRNQILDLARRYDVPAVAVVLDVPLDVALQRTADRPGREVGRDVVSRQHEHLSQAAQVITGERFAAVHVLTGTDQIEAATVVRGRGSHDRRDRHGPFDVIGDVHGCREELEELLTRLGYDLGRDDQGRAIGARHPAGRTAVFVGDLVDRGPDSPGVLRLVMGMEKAGHALAVPGNHEHKLVRALEGRSVRLGQGLLATMDQLATGTEAFRIEVRDWARRLSPHLVLDDGRLVVAHAGLKEAFHGRDSGRVRSFALYGDTTGEKDEFGLPVRLPWQDDYRGAAMVLYGHTPVAQARWVNNTMCLDTGCVFGGHLTALRYPEREVVQVAARKVWFEPIRPLG